MIFCRMLISRGFGVKKASVLSGVPKSTYYNRLLIKEMESGRYIPEKDVKKIVELCSIRTTYGYRRIWALLRYHEKALYDIYVIPISPINLSMFSLPIFDTLFP